MGSAAEPIPESRIQSLLPVHIMSVERFLRVSIEISSG